MTTIIANTSDLRTALNEGVVHFTFIKKDGSLRHARGTTCPDLIPVDNMPKGARTPAQQTAFQRQTVTFYDIDKKAWRSMCIETLWSAQRAMKLI